MVCGGGGGVPLLQNTEGGDGGENRDDIESGEKGSKETIEKANKEKEIAKARDGAK